jgi:hypothetical protein
LVFVTLDTDPKLTPPPEDVTLPQTEAPLPNVTSPAE